MNFKYIIRQIVKTFKKHYILATAIIAILAMGMSVNITIFMIINAALFRPLPVPESNNLVSLYNYDIKSSRSPFGLISKSDYLDLAEYGSSFDGLMTYGAMLCKLKTKNTRAQTAVTEVTSDNYFDVLGIRPIIGRTFTGNMKNNEGYLPVVISYSLWKNKFNSDPDVIGTYLEVNEKQFAVIGVMPSRFTGLWIPGVSTQLWIPFSGLRDTAFSGAETDPALVVGRLRNNASLSQAQAEMDSRSQWLDKTKPSFKDTGRNFRLFRTNDMRIAPDPSSLPIMRGVSLLLQTLVAAILFVVILNIAALFLAWGLGRKKEIAIIMAIGCTRGRIICQLLIESVFTSLIGGIFGLLIAGFLPGFIQNLIPVLPFNVELALDAPVDIRVVSFMFFLCLCTGVIAGLAPAIRASNVSPAVLIAENDVKTLFNLKFSRLHWIIVPQISVSLFLLIPAGLLFSSFIKIRNVYQTPYVKHSAVVGVDFELSGFSPERKDRFLSALKRETGNLRDIKSVCLSNGFPLSGRRYAEISDDVDNNAQRHLISGLYVSNDCFETFDIPLLHGRIFDERDDFPDSDSVIISESIAGRYWKESNPLNQQIYITEGYEKWKALKVIGVVKDVQTAAFRQPPYKYIFLPFSQNNSRENYIIGRDGSSANLISDRLRQFIYNLDDNIVIIENSTMQQYGDRQLYIIKALIAVFAIFGFSGILLTCIGIYGLISHSIAQRRHEIGIRIAVGAQRKDIIMMFLGDGLKMAIPGLILGNIGTALLIQILSKSLAIGFISIFIPTISLWEPFVFVGASAIALSGTMLACYIPTLKIDFDDPMKAIKEL